MSRRPPDTGAVYIVARYGLAEQANRRELWWLSGIALALVIGLAMVGLFVNIPELDAEETARLFARGAAGFYVLVAIIVLGMSIIRPEIDSGAAALTLSKPISRGEYVVGRYLGSAATLALTVAIMGVGTFLVVLFHGTADWVLLYDFLVEAFNAIVILAVMVLYAMLVNQAATAIFGFLTWEVAGSVYILAALVHAKVLTGFGAVVATVFVWLFPHVLQSPITAGTTMTFGDEAVEVSGPTIASFIWSLAWIVGALAAAILLFRRREL